MDDPNRIRHIFGEPRDNLDELVRRVGTEEGAFSAISDAVNSVFTGGDLMVDDNGFYKQVFEVGGFSVTVSGRVIDGVVRTGTAWIAV